MANSAITAKADDRGADRDLIALVAVHAARHGEEKRRQPGRVDGHEDGQEGIEKTVVIRHGAFPLPQASPEPVAGASPASPLSRRNDLSGSRQNRGVPI